MVCGCFLIPASLLYSLTAFLFLLSSSSAQSTTSPSTSSTTVAGNFASIVPTQAGYSYYGCYNETTGFNQAGNVRALAGNMVCFLAHPQDQPLASLHLERILKLTFLLETSSDSMTVASCMAFCASSAFAGLEYGRECWCGGTLNADSSKLDDKTCSLRCSGDQNEICGGHLA